MAWSQLKKRKKIGFRYDHKKIDENGLIFALIFGGYFFPAFQNIVRQAWTVLMGMEYKSDCVHHYFYCSAISY